MEIKIPNLGDGIDSAIVISLLVKEGDTVTKDQTLIELETDKAVAPVPAPASGTITSLTVKEGDTVANGTLIGQLDGGGASSSEPVAAAPAQTVPVAGPVKAPAPVVPAATASVTIQKPVHNESVATSISIQKLAYRIGLDLRYICGTGSSGQITETDLINHIGYLQSLLNQPSAPVGSAPKPEVVLPDFEKWGTVDVEKCSPLRKKIAEKMVTAWQTVPHVTQQLDVDITGLMALRKKYNPQYQKKGAKLTLTVFAIKAVQRALEKFPQFNASYDAVKNEIIKKKYYHMGIAVDTENGLIVPVIKDVDKKSLLTLAKELAEIADKAKDRTLSVEELQGSTFTISNLGGLGVGAFTPIINTPEVAILGIGSGEFKPTGDGKTLALKMPTCLSYDHRIIDGADGARFAMEVKNQFETLSESEIKEIS